jgi:hypothetical protein
MSLHPPSVLSRRIGARVLRKLLPAVALAASAASLSESPASADATCYTGCTPPGGPVTGSSGSGPATNLGGGGASPSPPTATAGAGRAPASAPASGGIPFTGADIAETAAIGSVLVVGGTVMVMFGRRRKRLAPPTTP